MASLVPLMTEGAWPNPWRRRPAKANTPRPAAPALRNLRRLNFPFVACFPCSPLEAPPRTPLPQITFLTAPLLDEFVFWVRQIDSYFKGSKLGGGNTKSSEGIFKSPLEPSYWILLENPFQKKSRRHDLMERSYCFVCQS